MKSWHLILLLPFLMLTSCEDDFNITGDAPLSDTEIANGLKQALQVGTDTASSNLAAKDGYFRDVAVKILLPEAIQNSISKFKSQSINLGVTTVTGQDLYDGYQNNILGINIKGLQSKEQEIIKGINRAAESAASEAAPIFVNAITSMTIQDARDILFSNRDTAATHYLRQNTYGTLFNKYEPKIDNALNQVKVGNESVVKSYESFVTDYNAILNTGVAGSTIGQLMNVQPVSVTDLSQYSTNEGLHGLFFKISEEERDIRQDPLARVNDLLKRVFGELD